MSNTKISCICCGFSHFVKLRYQVESHFYNSDHSYNYFWCDVCKILWLDRSAIISYQQYDEQYYSFRYHRTILNRIKIFIKRLYFDCFFYFGLEFSFINEYVLHRIFRRLKIDKKSSIIDVGCGSGRFIDMLMGFGYLNTVGIDPFAVSNFSKKINISNVDISEVKGKFEVINAHHVLEHTSNPKEFMFHVNRILVDDGIAIITFPRFSSLIEYDGHYSYLLQAPDHQAILSDECFRKIIHDIGFEIVDFEFDGSGTFQWLVMSSLWRKGVNMKYFNKKCLNYLTANELKEISNVSKQINVSNAANAIYVLKKIKA